jgi:hypothetical protein
MKYVTISEARQPYLKVNDDVRFDFLQHKDFKTIVKFFILNPQIQLIRDRLNVIPNTLTSSILKVLNEET